MGGAHYRSTRIRHSGHARFAHQSHIVPRHGRLQQRFGIKALAVRLNMVTFFVHLTRQFGDVCFLNRLFQGHMGIHPFQKRTGALGVFSDPVRHAGRHTQSFLRQHIIDGRLRVTTKVQWRGHQIQRAQSFRSLR